MGGITSPQDRRQLPVHKVQAGAGAHVPPAFPEGAGTLRYSGARSGGRRGRPRRFAEALAAVAVAVLFTAGGAVYYCAGLLSVPEDTVLHNVFVNGEAVGGLTRGQALERFSGERGLPPLGVTLVLDGRQYVVTAQDIGAAYNVAETVEQALLPGHAGTELERLADILSLRIARRDFKLKASWQQESLRGIAEGIARENSRPAVNASVQFLPDEETPFAYTPEADGRTVDAGALFDLMKTCIDASGTGTVTAESTPVLPEVTMAALKEQTQLIGTFTTGLKPDPQRTGNIKLAGAAVNGSVIFPDQEFSFNGCTGERTQAKGYAKAPTISGGQLVDAPGGGVCQASTTIYNAALLAGLEVAERHNHTWPLSYAEVGRDATVDWGTKKDLRVRNNAETPVYLLFRVDEAKGLVTAEFYGMPGIETISVVTEGYATIMPEKPLKYSNPNKPVGWTRVITKARSGYKVDVYRVFTDGTDSRRELVSRDYYPAQRGEIEIGTMPPGNAEK